MKSIFFLLCLLAGVQVCTAQTNPKKEFYSAAFNWSITLPDNFVSIDSAEMARLESKGAAVMDKANNTKVENHATLLFSVKTDLMNHIDCSYQPFNPAVDGDYLETKQAINNMLYKTITTQLQGVKVDTTTRIEKISNLEFNTFVTTVTYPNKMVLHSLMYYRLFGKREFSLNIVYKEEEKGQQMLNAWKGSKFGK
ncbi:hypothetical protein A4D02_20025 [Niastella koreensis]|uniref:Uncharacterized protein n=2 Tax=Niastella koreensis TaxID=354356 RepID=G8TIV8_NIAKG|nr:hypothetical protein [Niastella koreensis]AEV96452.1 hypothetical protein Niako_0050 [Niastella koreensis GR20-10]OQP53978.1 hypothetical protein A4D02_20025 [Niastella koreensis]